MVAVVLMAVFAIAATVITMSLSGDNDQDRIERVADELHRISSALDSGGTGSFKNDMPRYPSNLSALTHRIASTDIACTGNKFAGGDVAKWKGPYYPVPIDPAGHYLAPGFVLSNTIFYTTTNPQDLRLQIPNVSLSDANLLDVEVDGVSDLNNGIVRYTSTGPSIGTVFYRAAIPNNSC